MVDQPECKQTENPPLSRFSIHFLRSDLDETEEICQPTIRCPLLGSIEPGEIVSRRAVRSRYLRAQSVYGPFWPRLSSVHFFATTQSQAQQGQLELVWRDTQAGTLLSFSKADDILSTTETIAAFLSDDSGCTSSDPCIVITLGQDAKKETEQKHEERRVPRKQRYPRRHPYATIGTDMSKEIIADKTRRATR